jgi:hypothetical protein
MKRYLASELALVRISPVSCHQSSAERQAFSLSPGALQRAGIWIFRKKWRPGCRNARQGAPLSIIPRFLSVIIEI